MAILGVGLDLVPVVRLERALAEDEEGPARDLFTAGELAVGAADRLPARHFAAAFAAKEALFKALALPTRDGASWREVELSPAPPEAPALRLSARLARLAADRGVCRAHLALAHGAGLAVAAVVLEGDPPSSPRSPEEIR